MHDLDVMNDMGPTNSTSLAIREAIKTDSIIDSLASINDPYGRLNHWVLIICSDFERNNQDFQQLKNVSNSTQFVTAPNHIVTEFSSLQYDNIELNRNIQNLSTLVEMYR